MSLPHPDAKRKMVRDGFVRDHGELILQYDKLLQIIPDPCVPSSKRTWERQMYHVHWSSGSWQSPRWPYLSNYGNGVKQVACLLCVS